MGGGYRLKSSDLIVSEQIDDNVKSAIAEFAAHLQAVAGGKNSIISGEEGKGVVFSIDTTFANEAYTIETDKSRVQVKANS